MQLPLVATIVTNRDNPQNHNEEAGSDSGLYCELVVDRTAAIETGMATVGRRSGTYSGSVNAASL